MKLSEAAFIFSISEKTLRRAIAAGRLQTTRDRHGVYDVTIEAVQAAFGVQPRHIQLDAPEPYQDALRALSDRVMALEAILTRPNKIVKLTDDTTESPKRPYVPPIPGTVTRQRAAELAAAHGVGANGPLKSWKHFTANERPNEETVLRYIQQMAPTRFTKCLDLYCPCQEL